MPRHSTKYSSERASAMISYVLIIALVALACIPAITRLQQSVAYDCGGGKVGVTSAYGRVIDKIDNLAPGGDVVGNDAARDSHGCPVNQDDNLN